MNRFAPSIVVAGVSAKVFVHCFCTVTLGFKKGYNRAEIGYNRLTCLQYTLPLRSEACLSTLNMCASAYHKHGNQVCILAAVVFLAGA
jgi:hypothetical protein